VLANPDAEDMFDLAFAPVREGYADRHAGRRLLGRARARLVRPVWQEDQEFVLCSLRMRPVIGFEIARR
jgi:hypothetical protein